MRKRSVFLFLLIVCSTGMSILFDSCKKGEKDPLFSFRTRDQRLRGDWQMVNYTNDATNSKITTTNFNQINPCDTLGIIGIRDTTITAEHFADGTTGVGELTEQTGANGNVYTFNMDTFSFVLQIHKNGDYTATGNYKYYNSVQGLISEGTFDNVSKWYWQDGTKDKDGLKFIDFPILDISAVDAANGVPIRYYDEITFEVRGISHTDLYLRLEENSASSSSYTSDSYDLPGAPTDSLCILYQQVDLSSVQEINFHFESIEKEEE